MKQRSEINLQFVAVIKPGHSWKSSNERVVRSHVMRHVRRQKREEQMKQAALLTTLPVHDAREKETYEKNSVEHLALAIPAEGQEASASILGNSPQHQIKCDFNNLRHYQVPGQQLSAHSYRLLLHISNFFSPLVKNLSRDFVLWTKGVRLFITIASSYDFLMHAILAWSACHLAEIRGDNILQQHALRYRSYALKGLQRAIDSFSKENADAVLCTSIALSWQCLDPHSWAVMRGGCETVKAKMADQGQQSSLYSPAVELCPQSDPEIESYHGLLRGGQTRVESRSIFRDILLDEALSSLSSLQAFVAEFLTISAAVNELITFIEDTKTLKVPCTGYIRPQLLRPLKEMLFWFPSRYLCNLNAYPSVMLLMAHLHATALITAPLKDNDSANFRRLNAAPIRAFNEEFCMRAENELLNGESHSPYCRALEYMDFPLRAVAAFDCWLENFQSGRPCFSSEGLTRSGLLRKYEDVSMLRVLEDFPVGLWCHTLS